MWTRRQFCGTSCAALVTAVSGVRLLPELSSMTVYLLMAVVLLWRPEGIFGRRI